MALYTPPSAKPAAAGAGAPSSDSWNVFSSRKKFAPRSEFAEDAARAFGRRQEAPSPFGSSNTGGRSSHYDTAAFGKRGGGSSVFTDDAANAFGRRSLNKKIHPDEHLPRPPAPVRNDSLGAHLAHLGLDLTEKQEWKQSALRTNVAPAAPVQTLDEMFPALASSPKSPAIPKSESKGSFKDIIKKRAELDAAEQEKKRQEAIEKARKEREAASMLRMATRIRPRVALRISASADEEEEEYPEYHEDDLDALAQYDKPQRNYVHYDESETADQDEDNHDNYDGEEDLENKPY